MLALYYVALSVLMTVILLIGYFQAATRYFGSTQVAINKSLNFGLFLAIYIGYLGILSYFGILANYGLPPRFPIFLLLPFVGFCIYFYNKNKNNLFIQTIPLHWTIFYQSFRIAVELLLLYTFLAGIIPEEATFEGHNFDIAIGIIAIPIGIIALRTKFKYKRLLIFWNVLGIAMIAAVAFTIATSIYLPNIWGYSEPAVQKSFVKLPYLLLPAFLAPSAIVMHLVSLIQLRAK